MNTGTEDGGGVTAVGDDCFLMVGAHVGARLPRRQQCRRSPTTRCSAATVEIGDHVFIGGQCAVHQFVRIGEGAMIVGVDAALRADVIPFGMAARPLGRARRPQRRRHAPARLSARRHSRRAARLSRCCSSATGDFAARIDRSRPSSPASPEVAQDRRLSSAAGEAVRCTNAAVRRADDPTSAA